MTPVDYTRARRTLLRRDPVLAALIRQHGACGLRDAVRVDHFSALVRSIVFQQLSTKAATTIHARLVELLPGGQPTPEELGAISEEQFRTVGVSRQKSSYLRDLCEKLASGEVRMRFDNSGTSENIGETLRYGLDLELAVKPVHWLSIWGAYSPMIARLRAA